jgi:L-ascorbate metabolism protein UlaG (beta-lactamase superfamily)
MEIVWYGLSCFKLSERGLATVVTDPFGPEVGLPALKLKAEIVTISHDSPGHNFVKAVKGERRVIAGPGEFEIGGTFVTGIAMGERKGRKNGAQPNTIYLFDFEGVSVAHFGDLATVPSQAQIEELGAVGVALVPVGGGSALSSSQAAEVISMIEPSIVIPMHYKTGQLDLKLGTVNRFLSEMGIKDVEPRSSLKVSASDLSEDTHVVVLEPTMKE